MSMHEKKTLLVILLLFVESGEMTLQYNKYQFVFWFLTLKEKVDI